MIVIGRKLPEGEIRTIVNVYTGARRNMVTGQFGPDFFSVNAFKRPEGDYSKTEYLEDVRLPEGTTMIDVADEVMRQISKYNPDEIHGVSAQGDPSDPRNTLGLIIFGALHK